MKKSLGFTLIELLVTMTIMATLVTLAVPSVAGLVQSGNVASAVNTFLGDLRFTRSEAVRRNANVVMCRSNDPEASPPKCADATHVTGWATGWLVYENRDADMTLGDADRLLRIQAPLNGIDAVIASNKRESCQFTPLGRQQGAGGNIKFGSDNIDKTRQRLLCMAMTGRARIAGDGNASCS